MSVGPRFVEGAVEDRTARIVWIHLGILRTRGGEMAAVGILRHLPDSTLPWDLHRTDAAGKQRSPGSHGAERRGGGGGSWAGYALAAWIK